MLLLVAFDFTPAARRALGFAVRLQRERDARIHVVHVLDPSPSVSAPVAAPLVEADGLRDDTELRRAITDAGAVATTEVIFSTSPGDAIVAAAARHRPDLVVLGTHGREGIVRMLLGSVAEHVIRHADAPVVTLRVAG